MTIRHDKIRKSLKLFNALHKRHSSETKAFYGRTHLCVLLTSVVALIFSMPLRAAPVIQWSPEKLTIEQMQSTQSSHVMTLKFSTNIQSGAVYVVPELQKWVTVSPALLGDDQQGQNHELVIAVNVPRNEVVGVYEGTLQIRQSVGHPQKVIDKPLPIKLTITPFVGRPLPPDPGAAGKQTLLGIDSDNDGVRDDVQRYINLTYPDEPKVQAALLQFANEYQGLLAQAGDREAGYQHAVKYARTTDCLGYIKGEEGPTKIAPALHAVILNTRQRSLAYIAFSDSLAGQVIAGLPKKEWKNGCTFDVDALGGVQ